MKKGSVQYAFLFLTLALLASSPLVLAGLGNWWNSITGKATSDSGDVYLAIGNTAPTVPTVANASIGSVTPVAGNTVRFSFLFNATDTDGVANLNDSTAMANVTLSGSTERANTSCTHHQDYAAQQTATYNCSITMFYYDGNGAWAINASITDINGGYANNLSTTVTYNLLHDTNFTDNDGGSINLTFPSISTSSTNTNSTNDPITIYNRGNEEALEINVTAYSLPGQTTSTEFIHAENVSAGTSGDACAETALVNATAVNMSDTLARGEGSTQTVEFCITAVNPTLSAQVYNTTGAFAQWNLETFQA